MEVICLWVIVFIALFNVAVLSNMKCIHSKEKQGTLMMILKSTLLSPEIYTYEKCRAMGKMKLSPGHTVKALRFSINAK